MKSITIVLFLLLAVVATAGLLLPPSSRVLYRLTREEYKLLKKRMESEGNNFSFYQFMQWLRRSCMSICGEQSATLQNIPRPRSNLSSPGCLRLLRLLCRPNRPHSPGHQRNPHHLCQLSRLLPLGRLPPLGRRSALSRLLRQNRQPRNSPSRRRRPVENRGPRHSGGDSYAT